MVKVLNLFAGIGGNRWYWDRFDGLVITAVELNKIIAGIYKQLFPNDTMIIGDAYSYCEENYADFDIIWGSPECIDHSTINRINSRKSPKMIDLRMWSLIMFLQDNFSGNWVVENVHNQSKKRIFIHPQLKLRKNWFWSNLPLMEVTEPDRPQNYKDMRLKDLCEFHQVDPALLKFYTMGWRHHDPKASILRNMVYRDVGFEIMKQLLEKRQKQKKLLELEIVKKVIGSGYNS